MRKLTAPDVFEQGVKKIGGKTASAAPKVPGVLSGQLGSRYDGKLGSTEGTIEVMHQLVTLDRVRTVTVQLWQETYHTQRDPITFVPTPDAGNMPPRPFWFDATPEDTSPGDMAAEHVRISTDKQTLYISKTAISLGFDFQAEFVDTGATTIKFETAGYFFLPILGVVERTNDWAIDIGITGPAQTWPIDGFSVILTSYTPQPDSPVIPNATARARLRMRAGQTGEILLECDWGAKFDVVAQSIEIDRVSARPNNGLFDYVDATVHLTSALSLDGGGQGFPPTYTIAPANVPASGFLSFPIPQFARRVGLLLKYNTGDAPLALINVAFSTAYEGGVGFIDALSARTPLFGAGMPIPHGATALILTNNSLALLQLGAVFHLGL